MAPHLDRWTQQFGEKGFTVVSIENGQATDLGSLEEYVRSNRIEYPVLYDTGGVNTGAYGVRGFPSAYVLNKNGRVVWEGAPLGAQTQAVEAAIQKALGS